MRKTALFIALFLTTMSFAQTTKVIGDYTKVSVFDQIAVTLIPGEEGKIEIEGSKEEYVNVVNKNGILKVKMNFVNSFQGEDIKVKLYYKNLTEIVAEQGASIKGETAIKATSLIVNAKTGGVINAKIDAEKVIVKSSAGSVVTLTGKATVQDVLNSSGAKVKNKDLSTNQSIVTVNAGGVAEVKASDLVEAKVRAGGEIRIYGKPKTINEKNVLGGVITKVE
ncbi:head GIN domain-containing protein [Myroides sp. N17-2]|uniref:head GIN domain-containing protein n=1 Tax=Myroides sp. N17-2 TaxID=2030799 RepID=UPI000EFACD13|nr:head GIN domain-containing protein [Myroides sp. N17-2]